MNFTGFDLFSMKTTIEMCFFPRAFHTQYKKSKHKGKLNSEVMCSNEEVKHYVSSV